MKTKLTLILPLALCIILTAAACTPRQVTPTPEPASAAQADSAKVTSAPELTAEPTPEPTPASTTEPFGAEIWAEIRANGFSDVDNEQFVKLRSAFYSEFDDDDEIWKMVLEVYSSVDVYISDIISREKAALYAEPEPTKSVDEMSFYERAYYSATPEQRERLENIKKPTGDYGDYMRQIGMITGKLDENLPRLTLEQARDLR